MIFISHRGNLDGPDERTENSPLQIDKALKMGFDCELDIWFQDGNLYLGHDAGKYPIHFNWVLERSENLWVHCKNSEALYFFSAKKEINYFWHNEEKHTLTSRGVLWNLPGQEPHPNAISVLPESHANLYSNPNSINALGFCTDYPLKLRSGFFY